MKTKKKAVIAATLVVAAMVVTVKTVNSAPGGLSNLYVLGLDALADSESGITCRCSTSVGQSCAVDNYGAICAPNSADKCWEYNLNCHQ